MAGIGSIGVESIHWSTFSGPFVMMMSAGVAFGSVQSAVDWIGGIG